ASLKRLEAACTLILAIRRTCGILPHWRPANRCCAPRGIFLPTRFLWQTLARLSEAAGSRLYFDIGNSLYMRHLAALAAG
ncbi:MAG TPA: hypothetical protein VFE24_15755, partial [Pirellulales bacterium]|nr:hypothetical protein [Pirellulales bacterium]